jgi:hypothetical protein
MALALLAGCSAAGGDASNPVTVRDSAGIAIVTNDLARLTAECAVDSVPTTLIDVAEGAPEYMLRSCRRSVLITCLPKTRTPTVWIG